MTVNHTVTPQTVDGKNTLTVKPFTQNRKVKAFKLISTVEKLIKVQVEENHKNTVAFGEYYDHTWDGYLIRYPDGKLVSPNALTVAFDRFVRKHDVKQIRFHDLKHSCASILYTMGVNLITIQEILVQTQLSTTLMYTHIIDYHQDNALEHMSD